MAICAESVHGLPSMTIYARLLHVVCTMLFSKQFMQSPYLSRVLGAQSAFEFSEWIFKYVWQQTNKQTNECTQRKQQPKTPNSLRLSHSSVVFVRALSVAMKAFYVYIYIWKSLNANECIFPPVPSPCHWPLRWIITMFCKMPKLGKLSVAIGDHRILGLEPINYGYLVWFRKRNSLFSV